MLDAVTGETSFLKNFQGKNGYRFSAFDKSFLNYLTEIYNEEEYGAAWRKGEYSAVNDDCKEEVKRGILNLLKYHDTKLNKKTIESRWKTWFSEDYNQMMDALTWLTSVMKYYSTSIPATEDQLVFMQYAIEQVTKLTQDIDEKGREIYQNSDGGISREEFLSRIEDFEAKRARKEKTGMNRILKIIKT